MTTAPHQQSQTTAIDQEQTRPLHLSVIAASVRDDRSGLAIASWAVDRARATGAETTLIDLARTQLPDDRLLQPGGGPRSEIAAQIDASDGFVIVTPEYNHSYPASLKRAIDWHYDEWMLKAATVISYGAHGGLLATEHLRGVFAELHVVTTRSVVGLRTPWEDIGDDGYTAPAGIDRATDRALAEVCWWSALLRVARTERSFPGL